MFKRTVALSVLVAGGLMLNGCDTMVKTDKQGNKHLTKTAIGAGIGAVGGGIVGATIGGTQGAVIGAGAGAAAGGLIGNQLDH
ncbi:MAG: YMGG-like glycine zipper-containing protein [Gammaproteobacteria bacterium]|nr:YMGG-like glycine zipper-containing protein [Gammaproteobacteria bacterium]